MEEFLRCLLSLSLGGSLIAGLILLLRGGTRNKLPKSFYYYAWLLVLLRLALPIPGQMDLQLPEPSGPVAEFTSTSQSQFLADLPATGDWDMPESPIQDAAPVRRPDVHLTADVDSGTEQQNFSDLSMTTILVAIWAAGFLYCILRDLIGYFRFRHAIRATLIPARSSDFEIYRSLVGPRHPQLCRCPAVDTPMLMGILHPTLLLPDRRYSPEVLECVFRHELIHYARRDILYKWFAVPVLAMHWFNPLTAFIRRDIDRCCELSCDERLLKEMSHDQRKSYGESLLVLAARSAPSRTVLSTTFATEKKNLKERLVHIMNFSPKSKWTILAAVVLLIAVALCAIFFGPQSEPAPEAEPAATVETTVPETQAPTETQAVAVNAEPTEAETTIEAEATAVVVRTVDEFLAALGSNTEITLEPGVYDLTTAKDYGAFNFDKPYNRYYRWEEVHDGYQLVITNAKNLTITGAEKEGCEIVTAPRYAAVLNLEACENVKISTITAGHTEGAGGCVGSVILMRGSANVSVENCMLYGCGTYGVEGYLSNLVNVENCDIYDCSLGAVRFVESLNVNVHDSKIYDCGLREYGAYELFAFHESRSCAVVDCEVTNSNAANLLAAISCKDIYFISNQVSGCKFSGSVIDYIGAAPIVDSSSFKGVGSATVITTTENGRYGDRVNGTVPTLDGMEIDGKALKSMAHKDVNFTMPFYEGTETPTMPDDAPAATGQTVNTDVELVEVSTVDELLAAIKPNTVVKMAAGTYDLSTASDYGTGWTDYYRWTEVHDGFELELMNLKNFHIQGAGKGKTILSAKPRYAEVLLFKDCANIFVSELTAGHTIEPGSCTGGVLTFERCSKVSIGECGLYGCGIYGITATDSSDFGVIGTEIYDCSYGAVELQNCTNMAFDDCDIHDCPMPYFGRLSMCSGITVDGETISNS